jgi:hypothetical protein
MTAARLLQKPWRSRFGRDGGRSRKTHVYSPEKFGDRTSLIPQVAGELGAFVQRSS